MASKQINIGLPGQAVTADSLQAAFAKVNSNFTTVDTSLSNVASKATTNRFSAQQAFSSGFATIRGDLPTDGSVIYGLPANNGPVTGEKFVGSPNQFYSVGGYVPGAHMYGQVVIAMQTERDHHAQEQGLAVQMINSTGKPPAGASAGDINNGKSAFTVATRVETGGGNSWGAAIAQDIGPNVGSGFFATIEVDTNNFNAASDVGSGPQIAGIFFNTYSTFTKLAAIWLTGYEPQGDRSQKYWQYGMLVQSSNMIAKDMFGIFTGSTNVLHSSAVSHANALIYDESSGPYGYLCTGTRSSATLSLQDNSPVGLDVAGIKGAFGIRVRDSAPVGLSIQGSRSSEAIDVSQASTGTAIALSEGQTIKFGSSYDLYVANDRVYIRRRIDSVNVFSVDINGTVRAAGPIIGNTTV
jgi:hypothetical protein